MIGTNKIILNDATIAEAVQRHMNEHVMADHVTVTRVEIEYAGTVRQWVAYIEQKPEPIVCEATLATKP